MSKKEIFNPLERVILFLGEGRYSVNQNQGNPHNLKALPTELDIVHGLAQTGYKSNTEEVKSLLKIAEEKGMVATLTRFSNGPYSCFGLTEAGLKDYNKKSKLFCLEI